MWPFGFSLQELLGLSVVLTVAGGYRSHFLQASRRGGLFVGRAVGFIRQKRDQVFTSTAQKRELDSLHQQLSDAMSELQNIRYDIRSSARPFPADASRSQTLAARGSGPGAAAAEVPNDHAESAVPRAESPTSNNARVPPRSIAFDAADPLGTASQPAAAGQLGEAGTSPAKRFNALKTTSDAGKTVHIGGVPLVAVSAADVRPKGRKRGPTTGSHIVSDALDEQEIADQVTRVLQGSVPQG